ncbi:ATP-binding protein [Paraburkholderia sp. IMGN_8]|uniref:ATP-binding protein n=1 Tax=Paraburkholderia sp. IMGN_8 TaxID=3136564 RepID=UPI003100ACFE
MAKNVTKVDDQMDDDKTKTDEPFDRRRKHGVTAVYHDPLLEPTEYRDNPLILALPPFHRRLEVATAALRQFEMPYSQECRTWSDEIKLLSVQRISLNGIALPIQIRISDWLHAAIRTHYHLLQPMEEPDFLQRRYAALQNGEAHVLGQLVQSHSGSMLVIGISGVGKTTAAKLGVSQFPRFIGHESFNGRPFLSDQVVWIHVTCPHNGSIKSLCKSILAWVDDLLGTFYEREMLKHGVNSADYVEKVGNVLLHHMVGVLIIDEIQNAMRATDQREVFDMLVNMLNKNSCPVLAIGTPEVATLAPKAFRLARRMAGRTMTMEPFRKGPKSKTAGERDLYLNGVTRLDFLPTPFTNKQGVHDALMAVSAGVPAFITLAWILTQHAGIVTKAQEVTPSLIVAATKQAFSIVSGLLAAIESRDIKKLATVSDLAITEVREYIEKLVTDDGRTEYDEARDEYRRLNTFYRAVGTLVNLGIGQGSAELEVATIQREEPALDAIELVRKAIDRCRVTIPKTEADADAGNDTKPEATPTGDSVGSNDSVRPNQAPETKTAEAQQHSHVAGFRSRKKASSAEGTTRDKGDSSAEKAEPQFTESRHPASEEVI